MKSWIPTKISTLVLLTALFCHVEPSKAQQIPIIAKPYENGYSRGIEVALGTIEIGTEAVLVRLQTSELLGYKQPILGEGSSLSIIDSRLYKTSETEFLMHGIHGGVMVGTLQERSEFITGAVGEAKGDKVFVDTGDGWKYVFNKGMIERIESPSGGVATLKRSRDRVRVLVENKEVLNLSRGSKQNKVELLVGKDNYEFKLVKRPRVQKILGAPVVLDLEPAVGEIYAGMNTLSFSRDLNQKGTIDFTMSDSFRSGKEVIVSKLDPVLINGVLEEDLTDEQKMRNRVYQRTVTKDGHIIERKFIGGGNLMGVLREISIKFSDGDALTTRYYYDEKGEIIRTVNLNE